MKLLQKLKKLSLNRHLENYYSIVDAEIRTPATRLIKWVVDLRCVFSKIRTDEKKYIPKKTAICLALALELNLDEFNKLLNANNDYIGENNYFDIAIVWCIKNNIYDIEQVNDILYACNLQLLTKD